MKEPLIVYIIADNRSGSTLLDYMLSCHPEATSLGELHHLHGHYFKTGTGKSRNWTCSCGEQVQECSFWSGILKKVAFNEAFETKFSTKVPNWSITNKALHSSEVRRLLNRIADDSRGQRIAENVWQIYKTVHDLTKKKIIIDSSKVAFQAYLLNKHKMGNIKFLLLERDIRAVAYSKLKRRRQFSKEVKAYYGLKDGFIQKDLVASYKILGENRLLQKKISSLTGEETVKRIKYEDLTMYPEKTMKDVYSFLKLQYQQPPELTNQNPDIQHVLCGSPSRYEQRKIQPDTHWQLFYKENLSALFLGNFLNLLLNGKT